MSKRTVFTTITPLPAGITRDIVLEFLHNHTEMIDLNPLVTERHPIKPPRHATAEEFHCVWYSLTDRISYLPGVKGDVTYTCAFHDLPDGLQTHCYAPAGLDIRDRWSLKGTLPGEPIQPSELGVGAPMQGLYIREDVDMRCNFVMSSFVKKTLKKAHASLVDRLKVKAQIVTAADLNQAMSIQQTAAQSHREGGNTPGSITPALASPSFFPTGYSSAGSDAGSFASQPPYPQPLRLPNGHSRQYSQQTASPPLVNMSHSPSPRPASAGSPMMPPSRGRDASGRVSWQALSPRINSSSGGSPTSLTGQAPPPDCQPVTLYNTGNHIQHPAMAELGHYQYRQNDEKLGIHGYERRPNIQEAPEKRAPSRFVAELE